MSNAHNESTDYASNLSKLGSLEEMISLIRQDPWIETVRRLPIEEKLEITDGLLSDQSIENRLLRLIQVAVLLMGEEDQEVVNRVTYCLDEIQNFLSSKKWDYRPLIFLASVATISLCLVTR